MSGEFATPEQLAPLLHPRGIAVIGASAEEGKFSSRLIPSLQACGYTGAIHPVNPRYDRLGGLPCHPSVAAVPDPCDLVIVAVPARHVPGVVREASARGVGAAVVLSAGFAEIGPEGEARTAELRAAAGTMRLYGPNCPGLWQIRDGLVYSFTANFDPAMLHPGPVGLITQGGALGRTVLDAMGPGLGFSYWFSTGNEVDLDAADFLAFLAEDTGTRAVALIVEGWRDGRRFLRALKRCRGKGKPVVLLRIGRTPPGAAATRAHTAPGPGDPLVAEAALRSAGCILASDVDELTGIVGLLATHPLPLAGGLGICSFSGGAGGLLADLAHAHHLPLARLDNQTVAALRDLLPEIAAAGNPTDVTTAALGDPALARAALELMLRDPDVAAVAFPLPHRLDAFDLAMTAHLTEVAAHSAKPVVVVAPSPAFAEEAARGELRRTGLPMYHSATLAVRVLAGWLAGRRPAEAPPPAGQAEDLAAILAALGARQSGAGGPLLRCTLKWDPAFGPAVICAPGTPWAVAHLAPLTPETARTLLAQGPWASNPVGDTAVATLVQLAAWAGNQTEPFAALDVDVALGAPAR